MNNENKTDINWLITINLNPYGNPYKIKKTKKWILHKILKKH